MDTTRTDETIRKHENKFINRLDPIHRKFSMNSLSGISRDIWNDKYRYNMEQSFFDTACRIVHGIYTHESGNDGDVSAQDAYAAIVAGLWLPGGRIIAGAGTKKRVTLMNCYVTGTIHDSMEGIMLEHTNFALTMQQGGGDGADFSPIRPEGAILNRTQTKASGPLPFMDMWNSMCSTIRSAGDRRGAMMAVIRDTHPDLVKIIKAKTEKGRLNNFNISILVSDAFMDAVEEDEEWLLYFDVRPWERDSSLAEHDFIDEDGIEQYVYAVWKARDLWEIITKHTYTYSEPGIIFIDRINELNNLNYCEYISCTNPCGEQPLPPHGACDLGHINVARCVKNPFTDQAELDYELIAEIAAIGTQFLDNVIDVTNYPLDAQRQEQIHKRRIGVGFTGLGDALAMLQIRYGTYRSQKVAEKIQQTITMACYRKSIELAKVKGHFKLFDPAQYISDSSSSFVNTVMPEEIRTAIATNGIRNGVLNTIAPVGTGSVLHMNVSSGLEPVFAHESQRKVLQGDDTYKSYVELSYSAKVYFTVFEDEHHIMGYKYPSYMVTIDDLTVQDHILVQGAIQSWIDASTSKTVNIPESMPYEEFVQVYRLAYNAGCKGCTTYRPSEVRGSILTNAAKESGQIASSPTVNNELRVRPEVLSGTTYKIKWPKRESALYVTINEDEFNNPYEMFITSKDGSYGEWTTALSLMITAIFRRGGDISFIPTELKQIQSLHDGAWKNGKYIGSLPAQIGHILEKHLGAEIISPTEVVPIETTSPIKGDVCPSCNAPALFHQEGCKKCRNCGFSEC